MHYRKIYRIYEIREGLLKHPEKRLSNYNDLIDESFDTEKDALEYLFKGDTYRYQDFVILPEYRYYKED